MTTSLTLRPVSDTVNLRWYTYSQNNSGGSFVLNESVGHYVFVEAPTAEEANRIAEDNGLYFDGCRDGRDCSCCGDRWYPQWREDSGYDYPDLYGEDIRDLYDFYDVLTMAADKVTDEYRGYVVVYRHDGMKLYGIRRKGE